MSEIPVTKEQKNTSFLGVPRDGDLPIHLSILFLAVFGLLMISSASMGMAVNNTLYLPITLAKQIVFLIAGYWFMHFFASRFSFSSLYSTHFGSWSLGIGASLVAAGLSAAVGGSRAWIRIPISGVDLTIQPSEFAKVMLILIIAAYCGDIRKRYPKDSDLWSKPVLFVLAYMIIVLIMQRDLGSMVVMGSISLICFEIPSHPQLRKIQRLLALLLLLGIASVFLILSPMGEKIIRYLPLQDYQINRILSAINPFIDQYDAGFQLVNGLVSFASGGWTGLGFGNSVRKYTKFPAANNDFILAIVVEELGIFGFFLIFIPYCIIVFRLINYALKMRSERGKIILIGVAMYIVIHALFNIGGVTGMIPLTGVPLLMISAGGSSTLALMSALGIAQAVIARYKRGEFE